MIYRAKLDGSGIETLHEFNLLAQPPLGINPNAMLHAADSSIYFVTLQQVSFTGAGQNRPFLLRYGPVLAAAPVTGASQPVVKTSVTVNGQKRQFVLALSGSPGQQYDVQSSATLPPAWQSLQKVTADSSGNAVFQTDILLASPAQFYRVGQ